MKSMSQLYLRIVLFTAMAIQFGTSNAFSGSPSKDIVETAVSADGFQTLVAAVEAAGLVETLKGNGPFTVFAPNDDAFNRLPAETLKSLLKPQNKSQLASILTYHVVPGRVLAREAFSLPRAATVNGQQLDITNQGGRLSIEESQLLATDIECTNGVIHVIDRVLLPEQERIPSVAENAGKFGTLLAALDAAGLTKVLAGDGPFTVFAPTDAAFKQLPDGTVKSLLKPENKQQLTDILKYHVVSGRIYSQMAAQTGEATTLLGSRLEVSVLSDGLKVNESRVVQQDIESANGVVHAIDSVLLPQPIGPGQAMRTLTQAINRGVPLFNHGNSKACADIYMEACQQIVDFGGETMPASVMTSLKTAVDRAENIHHPSARAWALRHGMDAAM
ncbi:MAG: fasciclin domain-containing protein, partial [Planctomycetota bacterium]